MVNISTDGVIHVAGDLLVQAVGGNLNAVLGDAAGAYSLEVRDSANALVGSINSDGQCTVIQGIKVGNSTSAVAGTIRWTGSDFEVYKGSAWVTLTGGGVDPKYFQCTTMFSGWENAGGGFYQAYDASGSGSNWTTMLSSVGAYINFSQVPTGSAMVVSVWHFGGAGTFRLYNITDVSVQGSFSLPASVSGQFTSGTITMPSSGTKQLQPQFQSVVQGTRITVGYAYLYLYNV